MNNIRMNIGEIGATLQSSTYNTLRRSSHKNENFEFYNNAQFYKFFLS